MLGRLGFGKPTTIDALLDSRRVALEEILDMEDCLDQVRMRHKKLIDYMRQPLNLSQLIRYLVLGEKYAWVASEVIISAIPAIMDTLVLEHKEILLVYWTLLYQDYRLTPQQVVYFVKVNQVLLARRPGDMIRFLVSLSDLLPHWIYHLEDPQGSQLADLLVSVIQSEQSTEGVGIIKWLHEHRLIRLLVDKMDPSLDPMLHSIVHQLLCDVVRLSQTSHSEVATIGCNNLILDLTSLETMTRLIDSMLDTTASYATDSFICGAKLMINLIRYNDERNWTEGDPVPTNSNVLATMLACCTARIGDFLNLLKSPRSKGAIGPVLDLFFAFPSCNIAHSVVCDIVGQIFENKCLERKSNQRMALEVFTKGRLIQRILEADRQATIPYGTGTTPVSYMGHLTLLTKSIVQVFQKQPGLLRTLQDGVGGDKATIPWQEWDTFAKFTMDSCADLEVPLAGIPVPSPTVCPSPTSSFPLPPPPIHIPSLPLSIPHSSMPSPSLSPLPSLLPTELSVDAS
ncbi:hypothetical protein [Absidia glauca]|uniref:Uncharacterized protein n=1 Tax=Absidia glauca TaxID=4829 RepID=A0A168NN55_ABSGL|nr:hypothetical protein [Absidia glauca]